VNAESWIGLTLSIGLLFVGIIGFLLKMQLADIKGAIATIFRKIDALRCGEHDVALAQLSGKVEDHERRIGKLEDE